MEILSKISEALQKGKAKDVKVMVQEAVDSGIAAQQILNEGLLSGMNLVGIKFKNNEVYVPDVLIAARAMKAGTEILKPLLIADGVKASGRVVLGTVKGDLHDIGKNLVGMMMEGQGLEIIDAGTDVSADQFIALAQEKDAQIICCSALLTTTMGEMKSVVEKAVEAGIRDKVTIMVGGAPVNDAFAKSIGADIYTPDAASAAEAAVAALKARGIA
jgi:corrinoid protein of di/trimethylamine methyltransferase